MSKEQGGDLARQAAELQALDPIYVMPAHIKSDLATLFDALDTVGHLAGAVGPEDGPVFGFGDMAALNHSLSALGKRLLGDVAAHFPTAGGVPQV